MNKITVQVIHNTNIVNDVDYNYSIIHQYVKLSKQWKFYGYRCLHCENTFKTPIGIQKHKTLCKQLNTIKKRTEHMPIHKITKNGETYYRWGDHGKLYKNRADAEKQAAAAHASGYMEPKQQSDNKGK
jgi:hypothetical protein